MHLYFTFKFRNYLNQFSTPILSENLLKLNMIVIPARMCRRAYTFSKIRRSFSFQIVVFAEDG